MSSKRTVEIQVDGREVIRVIYNPGGKPLVTVNIVPGSMAGGRSPNAEEVLTILGAAIGELSNLQPHDELELALVAMPAADAN